MQDIQDFHIGTAFYILENKNGSKLRLSLNYAKNSFKYKILKDLGNVVKLIKQAEVVARNLLDKKAQKNLRDKLLQLKI